MTGGLIQLIAYGAQDIYLTGNPQVTFFKYIYRRHTNFAVEPILQHFSEKAEFNKRLSCTIAKHGDLLSQVILHVSLPAISEDGSETISWTNAIGHALIKRTWVEIGGIRMDTQYGEWMEVWTALTVPASKQDGFYNMIGKFENFQANSQTGTVELFVPLHFWFCRHIGTALPLIALQHADVKIFIETRPFNELWYDGNMSSSTLPNRTTTPAITTIESICDYIFLDTAERRRFAQYPHEYLIEQVQHTGTVSITQNSAWERTEKFELEFNHPLKELVWVSRLQTARYFNQWFNFSDTADIFAASTSSNPITHSRLLLNGHERVSQLPAKYFQLVQPYLRHTAVPNNYINLYSFALVPEELQPSGTCNFSRLDNASLELQFQDNLADSQILVYGFGYNVLRIMAGMAGLAHSN